ncbi:autophagy protein 16 [Meira miltonrushii]|uniref:Autophagy protein 16 n=1 Tax=Meira miltonrushii TaxID=1280837 RepID=A0A316VIQ6_9BASI|nr:autophagy protein 16 [Meira miltonrushii]PWN37426.1 autophagy protein 16 [Meira miltonrushii]
MCALTSSWQTTIRHRLEERDDREREFDDLVGNYQRLAKYAKQQKERNQSLLAASDGAATSSTKVAAEGEGTAVKQAYITSLEGQLQSMRDELATLYKTQSQNAQRLLVLNEQIRNKDEREREQTDESRKTTDEMVRLKRKEEDLRGVVGEKDKMIQLLQDELSALSLELNQVEIRNEDLKRDNASLLQRWLDRMNDEAEKMNEGNQFLQEVDHVKRKATGAENASEDNFSHLEKGKEKA